MEEKNKKPKQAIALEYNPEEEAPRIIASGRGALAERIIEKAKEADVPVHRDDKLADTLSRLEIGDMIPPELYEVVAEILIFVDSMDRIKAKMDKVTSKTEENGYSKKEYCKKETDEYKKNRGTEGRTGLCLFTIAGCDYQRTEFQVPAGRDRYYRRNGWLPGIL